MKRILLVLLFVSIISLDLVAECVHGLSQDVYVRLTGVWYPCEGYSDTVNEYSWGKAKAVTNGSDVIDLGNEPPWIVCPGLSPYIIKKIINENGVYFIDLSWNGDDYKVKVSFVDDNTIIFHRIRKDDQLFGYDRKYYRIDGPTIEYFTPTIPNLRLRSEPSEKGATLRLLSRNEKLLLVRRGKEETIGGVRGTWFRVLTEKNETGWCFSPYLKEI